MNIGKRAAIDLLPWLAGVFLVGLFTHLGFWQLDRADEKRAVENAFANPGEYLPVDDTVEPELYQPLTATGRWLADRQFLIDNAILDGRLGYYVITPFEYAPGEPLLLVNRGWQPKEPGGTAASGTKAVIALANDAPGAVTISGRAGQLPRVGIRAGEAFTGEEDWPRTANWPSLDELAGALEGEVLPYVLLADPEPGSELLRRWEPRQSGPARHLGYAVQWFGLAATVIVVAAAMTVRRRRSS